MKESEPVKPRCPHCDAKGINQIEAKQIGFFILIYCKSCGAIHGVVPKPQEPEPKQEEKLNLSPIQKKEAAPQKTKKLKAREIKQLHPDHAEAMAKTLTHPGSTRYKIIRNTDD